MGQEAQCTVRFADRVATGKARLESAELIFRGDAFRLAIKLPDIRSLEVDQGQLRLTVPAGTATFELGPLAEKWAGKIRNPKSLIDKLDVKPGSRVAVLRVKDDAFWQQLAARTDDIAEDGPQDDSDLIFLQAETSDDLLELRQLRRSLKSNGAIWVVAPKGKPHLRDVDILAAGRAAGLVDIKVVAFSATHTALKLVVPRAQRKAGRG